MSSFKIGDIVRFKDPSALIHNEDLDEEFREFVRLYKRDELQIRETKEVNENNQLKKVYFVVNLSDAEECSEWLYYEELELLSRSEWDD
jgi:hypothetical protein